MALRFKQFDATDDLAIKDFIKEKSDAFAMLATDIKLKAERNEQYVSGNQWIAVDVTRQSIVEAVVSHLPQYTLNYLRNITNAYVARLTGAKPSVKVYPSTAKPEARAAADIANRLIDYYSNELQIDRVVNEVVKSAAIMGSAGIKVCYNPEDDDVALEPVTIHDVILDATAGNTPHLGKFVIFKNYIDPWIAKEMLVSAGVAQDPPVDLYSAGPDHTREGTLVHELWLKPNAQCPQGIYCKVIGDNVIDAMDYPYVLDPAQTPGKRGDVMLPLVWFQIDPIRQHPLGDTWLNDVIPLQRQINEVEASLMQLRRLTSNVKLVVPDSITKDSIDADSQVIVSSDGPNKIGYLQTPQIPSLLFADRDRLYKNIYDIAGLSDTTTGVRNNTNASGRAIAYLEELDAQKSKHTSELLNTMIVNLWELLLKLIQRYFVENRVYSLLDKTTAQIEEIAFLGSDLNGITVAIEPDSGINRSKASRILAIEEDMTKGLADGAAVLNARKQGGIADSAQLSMAKQLVEVQLSELLQGGFPQVDTSIPAELMINELNNAKVMLLSMGQLQSWQSPLIDQLIAQYSQLLPAAPAPEQT